MMIVTTNDYLVKGLSGNRNDRNAVKRSKSDGDIVKYLFPPEAQGRQRRPLHPPLHMMGAAEVEYACPAPLHRSNLVFRFARLAGCIKPSAAKLKSFAVLQNLT